MDFATPACKLIDGSGLVSNIDQVDAETKQTDRIGVYAVGQIFTKIGILGCVCVGVFSESLLLFSAKSGVERAMH